MMKHEIRTAEKEARSFDVSDFDAEKRTARFSASSEFPVERYDYRKNEFYDEILSHDPADADLSRMSGAPLLDTHFGDVIGVVESAEIVERKMVVSVRFSAVGARAKEIFQDLVDGIRRNVSIGYRKTRVLECKIDDKEKRSIRFAWQPYEVSMVSIPADPTVGVGRAASEESEIRSFNLPGAEEPKRKLKKIIVC